MFLSIDCYYCIVNLLIYVIRMLLVCINFFILFLWLVCLFLVLLFFVGWGKYGYEYVKFFCIVIWSDMISEGYMKFYFVVILFVLLLVMIVIYYYILKVVC